MDHVSPHYSLSPSSRPNDSSELGSSNNSNSNMNTNTATMFCEQEDSSECGVGPSSSKKHLKKQPYSKFIFVKKTSNACVACRKAHAGCSHERPCLRCVRRGIQCREAVDSGTPTNHNRNSRSSSSGGGAKSPRTPATTPKSFSNSSSFSTIDFGIDNNNNNNNWWPLQQQQQQEEEEGGGGGDNSYALNNNNHNHNHNHNWSHTLISAIPPIPPRGGQYQYHAHNQASSTSDCPIFGRRRQQQQQQFSFNGGSSAISDSISSPSAAIRRRLEFISISGAGAFSPANVVNNKNNSSNYYNNHNHNHHHHNNNNTFLPHKNMATTISAFGYLPSPSVDDDRSPSSSSSSFERPSFSSALHHHNRRTQHDLSIINLLVDNSNSSSSSSSNSSTTSINYETTDDEDDSNNSTGRNSNSNNNSNNNPITTTTTSSCSEEYHHHHHHSNQLVVGFEEYPALQRLLSPQQLQSLNNILTNMEHDEAQQQHQLQQQITDQIFRINVDLLFRSFKVTRDKVGMCLTIRLPMIAMVNKALKDKWGYTPTRLHELLHPSELERAEQLKRESHQDKNRIIERGRFLAQNKDCEIFEYAYETILVRSEEGAVLFVMSYLYFN